MVRIKPLSTLKNVAIGGLKAPVVVAGKVVGVGVDAVSAVTGLLPGGDKSDGASSATSTRGSAPAAGSAKVGGDPHGVSLRSVRTPAETPTKAAARKAPARKAPAGRAGGAATPDPNAPAAKKSASKQSAAKQSPAKKTAGKASPATKAAAKKAPAKRSAAALVAAQESSSEAPAAAPAARKAAGKKAAAKKAASEEGTATKAPATKAPAKKAPAAKSSPTPVNVTRELGLDEAPVSKPAPQDAATPASDAPVTDIDARADVASVTVTPADVAPAIAHHDDDTDSSATPDD